MFCFRMEPISYRLIHTYPYARMYECFYFLQVDEDHNMSLSVPLSRKTCLGKPHFYAKFKKKTLNAVVVLNLYI